MSLKHNLIFWLKENLPYPPKNTEHLNSIPEPARNGGFDDLPYNQATTPCISTSFYRFLPTEDGDSVFMNTRQQDNVGRELLSVKEDH